MFTLLRGIPLMEAILNFLLTHISKGLNLKMLLSYFGISNGANLKRLNTFRDDM